MKKIRVITTSVMFFLTSTNTAKAEFVTNFNNIERDAIPTFRFRERPVGFVISQILPWIFTFSGLILLLYFIWGGFRLMTSGGDQKAVADAKGKITNALVGFVIIFVAYWIVQIVADVFGLTSISTIFN